jgi:hypothetical protein
MAPIAARRYQIVLPRIWNQQRRGLSIRWYRQLRDDPAVVAFTAYDPTMQWRLDADDFTLEAADADRPRSESRPRVLFIDTAPRQGKPAAASHERIRALAAELADATPYPGNVVLSWWDVELETFATDGTADTQEPD